MTTSHLRSIALVALFASTFPALAAAVNLVPNPSFESYAPCPSGWGQINVCAPWDTPNTGTSDAFNACAPVSFPSVNVPNNQIGWQNALTGVGYAGIIPYSAAPDYREYVSAPLNSPLLPGQPYTLTFHVSLADSASLALDRLGAYFSVGSVGPLNNYAALPYSPQVESAANVYLTNATQWTTITGTFVAAGGENWITIGNFHDDATTNLVAGPGTWPGGSYYYIEDVSLELSLPTVQACCGSDGSCSMQYPGECTLLGGTPAGPGTTCAGGACNPTTAKRGTWGSLKSLYR